MFEEILKEMSLEGCTEATIKGLQVEMERMQWRHRQEMAELKHNTGNYEQMFVWNLNL